MVVLAPMLEGEKTRVCRQCGLLGIVSPDTRRSSFYANNHHGVYRTKCRVCYNADKVEWHRRGKERKRAREREEALPRHLAKMSEDERIDWHLERERRGIPLPLVEVGRPVCRGRAKKYSRPIGPLRAWIEQLVAQEEKLQGVRDAAGQRDAGGNLTMVESAVANRLDIDLKMLWRWRYEIREVDERWVDHVTRSEGSIRPEDLYPELECDG